MSTSPSIIIRKFKTLTPSAEWSFSQYQRAETSALSHSYHRYPAKFIPQLVNKVVAEFTSEGDTVLDPFGGCGTSLVEAKRQGRRSVGFDVNPVAKLITDTKTKAIKPEILEKSREEFLKAYIRAGKVKQKKLTHTERIYYWFDKPIVKKLDRVYVAILTLKNKDARRFFLCAFSHILKNCSRWLMKSIKPTVDKQKEFPQPQEVFLRHLDSMIKKNGLLYSELKTNKNLQVPALMKLQDSTKKSRLKNNSIDLIVTSPPYVTSYEYADLHQLSLLWFGDDKKHFKGWDEFSGEFHHFRKRFIGSSYKTTEHKNFGSKIATKIIEDMETKDRSMANSIARYFVDMKLAFEEMHRVLKHGKKACVIIGNTELNGVSILNAEVAAEQMIQIGFSRSDFIKREVSNKMITPWRDTQTGKFTGKNNPDKKRAYEFEYVLIMEKK